MTSSSASTPRTHLTFHHDSHLSTHQTTLLSITPLASLAPENQALFKDLAIAIAAPEFENPNPSAPITILTTTSTIFHPQGGGQPSDQGTMETATGAKFTVQHVRISNTHSGTVLHAGYFTSCAPLPLPPSLPLPITQTLNPQTRHLHSRYHTAGHILGSAVRDLLSSSTPNFSETKASHFPHSAACEFAGLIAASWKESIQQKVDEYVEADLPVEIEWWDEGDFAANGMEDMIPDREAMGMTGEEKFRVVRIVGAGTYPCGGTHVDSTRECGKTSVKKITRSKGTSRVGYTLD